MANNYYNNDSPLVAGLRARSDQINSERDAVEAAFDNLPAAADSLHTGKATFAVETGSGNLYEVSMGNTRTVNTNGDEVAFIASHTHPGVPSLNVDNIGDVEIRGVDLETIPAGGLQSGVIYVVRYNEPYWQLISPPESYSSAAASAAAAASSASSAAASAIVAGTGNTFSVVNSAPLVMNDNDVLATFCTLEFVSVSGADYIIEMYMKGTHASGIDAAGVACSLYMNAGAWISGGVDIRISLYDDYGDRNISSPLLREDANRCGLDDYAILRTAAQPQTIAESAFVLKGVGSFSSTDSLSTSIVFGLAQATATTGDTTFTDGWLKVTQVG